VTTVEDQDEQAEGRARPLVLAAMFIDTLGGGLFVPFELIYAHVVVGLPLTTAGAALAIAAAAGIAVGPIAGSAVDRFGPIRIVASASIFGIVGCIALFFAHGVALFATGSFFFVAAMRIFWGAFTPLVAELAPASSLDVWFGRIRAARFLGLAAGEALAGTFVVAGGTGGLKAIVVADGVSYLVAMSLILLAGRGMRARPVQHTESAESGGYRVALRDIPNVLLAGLNVADTLLVEAPVLAMPVLVIEQLGLGAWLPGVLAAITTIVGALGMTLGAWMLRGRRRLRNMQLAALTWTVGLLFFVVTPAARPLAVPLLVGAMALLGLGEAVYAPTADALPAALAPPGLLGRYAAIHQMAWGISETIAPLLVAGLLVTGIYAIWIALAALAILTVFAYRVMEDVTDRDGLVQL
jgi:MFS family permease